MLPSKIDLIIHPIRLRIMQRLAVEHLTTAQLNEAMPDIATSSLYRHIRLLLDNGLIRVVDERPVRGVAEKTYALAEAPHIDDPGAIADLSPEDHIRYFTMYTAALIQEFAAYIMQAGPHPDLIADRVGYTEAAFYASPDELDAVGRALNEALIPLTQNSPGADRHLHKLSIITHPVRAHKPADSD